MRFRPCRRDFMKTSMGLALTWAGERAAAQSEEGPGGLPPVRAITQGRALLPLIQALNPTRSLGLGKSLKEAQDSKIAQRLFRNFTKTTTL